MANTQNVRTLMGDQDPVNRTTNFKEVALGYSTGAAMNEADRCLNCKNKPVKLHAAVDQLLQLAGDKAVVAVSAVVGADVQVGAGLALTLTATRWTLTR